MNIINNNNEEPCSGAFKAHHREDLPELGGWLNDKQEHVILLNTRLFDDRVCVEISAVLCLRLERPSNPECENKLRGKSGFHHVQLRMILIAKSNFPGTHSGLVELHTRASIIHSSVDDSRSHISSVLCCRRKSGEFSFSFLSDKKLLRFNSLWHTKLFSSSSHSQFNRKISERTFIYQLVGNATFSVDTFFFISGLLVVLLFLKAEKSKKTSESTLRNEESRGVSHRVFWLGKLRKSFFFIFYRFLRLTPTYLIIIVFTELTMK